VDLKFSTLFLTGLANRFLGHGFRADPVPRAELPRLVRETIHRSSRGVRLKEKFSHEFFRQLSEFLGMIEKDERRRSVMEKWLRPFFVEFLDKYLDELGGLSGAEDIDVRYIGCVLVR